MSATPVATLVIRIEISLEQAASATGAPTTPITLTAVPTLAPDTPLVDAEPAAAAAVDGPRKELKLGGAQRDVLTWLADHNGVITDHQGGCTAFIAEDLEKSSTQVSSILGVLTARGLVARDVRGKRTYRISLTRDGRAAIGRLAGWADDTTPTRGRYTKPTKPTGPPPDMPDLGPIGHLPVDADAARANAAAAL